MVHYSACTHDCALLASSSQATCCSNCGLIFQREVNSSISVILECSGHTLPQLYHVAEAQAS